MTSRSRSRNSQARWLFLSVAPLPILALVLPRLPQRAQPRQYKTIALRPRVALVANNASDYWTIVRKGGEEGAHEAGVDLEFKIPAEGTASQQTQMVSDLLAQGVDALAVSPVDGANQGDILSRAASKTLLFTFDSDAPLSKRACYVGTDNIAAGRQAGEEVKRALPRGGSIMAFVGKADAPNARDRYAGLRAALRGSKVRVLGVRTDNTDRSRAVSNVRETLQRHPKLAACVGLWSYNGPAILAALKDAKKIGQVKIVAFDEEDDTLDGVAHGYVSAAIVQQPFEFGKVAVRAMAQVLAGDKSAIPASKKIFVPSLAIRRSNVAAFRKQLNKMRR